MSLHMHRTLRLSGRSNQVILKRKIWSQQLRSNQCDRYAAFGRSRSGSAWSMLGEDELQVLLVLRGWSSSMYDLYIALNLNWLRIL